MSDPLPRPPITLLVFSASLRAGSFNTRLAELAAVTVEVNGGEVDRGSMREFDAPSFDQDVLDRADLGLLALFCTIVAERAMLFNRTDRVPICAFQTSSPLSRPT